MKKRILFITKNYPPQIWGIEQYSSDFYTYLKTQYDVVLLANPYGKRYLFFFFFEILGKWLYYVFTSDAIWIWDASLAFFWVLFWKLFHKKIYITVHGLDITWKYALYQWITPKLLSFYDAIVCVSTFTQNACLQRGIPSALLHVIPNGISLSSLSLSSSLEKEYFSAYYGIPLDWSKKVLFSIGRHIERKGIHWFLETIFPLLSAEYIYIIAGAGPYTSVYTSIIKRLWLSNVFVIGSISDEEKRFRYQYSDLFIMPNIKLVSDIEWFWITIIEAGAYGLPCIASQLDGITSSILNQTTWILVPYSSTSPDAWVDCIVHFDYHHFSRTSVSSAVIESFSWERIIQKYITLIG